jgi:isochorismate pyruvate lyase
MSAEPSPHAPAARRFKDPAYQPLAANLAEVRAGIDALDQQIVSLLAQRAAWVKDATRFKLDAHQAAAPARQAEVFRRVRALAEAENAAFPGFPDLAEATYRTLVAEYVSREQSLLAQTDLIGDKPT